MKNKLVIFDIDGTLTNTNKVDSIYFEKAIQDVLLICNIDTNWDNYKYSTDYGIVTEIIQSKLNRDPTSLEIRTIKNKFVSYLESAFLEDNSLCTPIDGSRIIFESITARGWDIGIATGGWDKSAILKLKTARVPYLNVPIAHSDDSFEREKIISIAIKRAQRIYNKSSYDKIIYVGDRSWDKNAAHNLKIDFIGIGRELGAIVKKDFIHISSFTNSQLEDCLILLEQK